MRFFYKERLQQELDGEFSTTQECLLDAVDKAFETSSSHFSKWI